MGASKKAFMETLEGQQDIQEYFEWMTEQQWQEYCQAEIDKIHAQYGNGITGRIKEQEFLNKNK